jgi:hypothetical protein
MPELRQSSPAPRGTWARALIWWLLLVISPALLWAQESTRDRSLEFVKGPRREVVDNVYNAIRSVAVSESTIEAKFVLAGKAPPLSTPLLATLKGEDRQLYNEARKIESALKLQQDDREFYLRVFASVPISELSNGKKVSGCVVLLAIRTPGGVCYLPLIKTVTPR